MRNKEKIIQNLSQAQYSLNIAVSWLTDIDFINVIKEIAKKGIIIKIVLSKSEWNLLRYEDLKELTKLGSIINKRGSTNPSEGSFMHCKFCIIDDATVIHGSYNWTKNAAINDENLAIDKDYEIARKFNRDFHHLLKDSENYFNDIDEKSLKSIIAILSEKEAKGFDPETESIELNPDTSIAKKEQGTIKRKNESDNINVVKSWKFSEGNTEIKDIRANLYKVEEIKIQNYFKITIGDDTGIISCRIRKHLLLQSLLTNLNLRIVYSTLNGIPEILLSMLLANSDGLSIFGPMNFTLFEGTTYFEIISNNKNVAFNLSEYEPTKYKRNRDLKYDEGYNIIIKLIKGEMSDIEFKNRFKKINWWLN